MGESRTPFIHRLYRLYLVGNTRKNFSGLEIAVLHITLDKPLYLVLQRFPAGLTEMETDDIGGVVV